MSECVMSMFWVVVSDVHELRPLVMRHSVAIDEVS